MIGVAELDEFFALLIDRKKGHVPAIGIRRILDFAGGLVRNDLERHAELCGERAAKSDGNPAIAVAVFDGELRGRRRRDGNGKPQFPVGASSFNTAASAMVNSKKTGRRVPPPIFVIARRNYGFIPAGATCEFFRSMSSNAFRTRPDALASSMNWLT